MSTPTDLNIYGYNGSTAAAATFSAFYGILTTYHLYLSLCKTRSKIYKHRYTIPLLAAGNLCTAGYGIRAASVNDPSSIPLYAISASYIVVGPIFVCATLYWQMKYLVQLLLPPGKTQELFGLNPLWLGRIFLGSDILSFLTQCSGSGIASSGNWSGNMSTIGVDVLLGGLALQLATFTVYLVFLFRMVRQVHGATQTNMPRDAKTVLTGVWIAAAFVQIRTIYRLVEFILGIDGYPFQHEWCLYVFEGVPMIVALASLAWSHPVKHLQTKRYFEEQNLEKTEMHSRDASVLSQV